MTFVHAFAPVSVLRSTRHSTAAEAPSRAADPAVDRAVARTVETFDFLLVALAGWLLFAERFFAFAGPLLGTLCALAVVALGPALRPLGRLAGGALKRRWGRARVLTSAFLLLAAATAGMALVPAYDAAGVVAVTLLVLCRCGQGLALGACADSAQPEASAPAGWIGGVAGALLASGLFAVLLASLTGPDFRAWGWQYPFFAALPILLVALFARLRCG